MRRAPAAWIGTIALASIALITHGAAPARAATPSQAPPVTLNAVLGKAAAYVDLFVRRFSNVVTEEHYTQTVRRPRNVFGGSPLQAGAAGDPAAFLERRDFRSDVIIMEETSALGWIMLRDVYEVDGKPVRDRRDRLTRLLTQPASDARAQAARISDESARYNIGPGFRTTNTPELSIHFLQASLQPRFTFKLGSRERSMGERIWTVSFRERARPTLVRGEDDTDMPATGRFWIDVDTGRVAKTELNFKLTGGLWMLTTTFSPDERLRIAVPAGMREYYQFGTTETTGTATYGRFRTFGVSVSEQLGR